jgi:hypothetical protein
MDAASEPARAVRPSPLKSLLEAIESSFDGSTFGLALWIADITARSLSTPASREVLLLRLVVASPWASACSLILISTTSPVRSARVSSR